MYTEFSSEFSSVPAFLPQHPSLLDGEWEVVKDRLQDLALDPNGYDRLDYVFDIADSNAAQAMIHHWSNGIFPNLPAAMVVPDGLLSGSRGAYAAQTGTVYLAESTTGDPLLGPRVLAEEVGHHLDELLNPGGDTSGDEGEFFSKVLFGDEISNAELARLRSENDSGFINLDGTEIAVELDDTRGTAEDVGILSGLREFREEVGSSDRYDYYRFEIVNPGEFSLNLRDLTADADVYLLDLDSSEDWIDYSRNWGSDDESISLELSEGIYYALVYFYDDDGSTSYDLDLSIDGAGNSTGEALDIGTLNGTLNFSDFVGSEDQNDYYSFYLNDASTFRLDLSGLSADANVTVLDSDLSTKFSGSWVAGDAGVVEGNLYGGTYWVRVHPGQDANTNYNLSLTANDWRKDGYDSRDAAFNMGTLDGTLEWRDRVGSEDQNDYFRFEIARPSDFSLSLSGLYADANVRLLNSSGSQIDYSFNGGSSSENISRELSAGTYYVRVYPWEDANTNYNLSLEANAIDRGGNDMRSAANLGLLGTRRFTGSIGRGDTDDYIRFDIEHPSDFFLEMRQMGPTDVLWDVSLLDSRGGPIASSTREEYGRSISGVGLTPGQYYLHVSAPDDGVTIDYDGRVWAREPRGQVVDAADAVARAIDPRAIPFSEVPDSPTRDWFVEAINAPEVWKEGRIGSGVVVAVIDDGFREDQLNFYNVWRNKEELEYNFGTVRGGGMNGFDDDDNLYIDDVNGWNWKENNGDVWTESGSDLHGTRVASVVLSVAPAVEIMPLVIDTTRDDDSFHRGVVSAIVYAVRNGADVINLSVGTRCGWLPGCLGHSVWHRDVPEAERPGATDSISLYGALRLAEEENVVVVVAGGNFGREYRNGIAQYILEGDVGGLVVPATERNGEVASFSSSRVGDGVVYAPGVEMFGDGASGTSFAAPVVSGIAALMVQAWRGRSALDTDLSVEEVIGISDLSVEEVYRILTTEPNTV